MSRQDGTLKDKIKTIVAGETICWGDFERYWEKARPLTLSTLLKTVKVEAYLAATQDKVLTPRMKIAMGSIFAAAIIIAILYMVFTS